MNFPTNDVIPFTHMAASDAAKVGYWLDMVVTVEGHDRMGRQVGIFIVS